MRVQRLHLVDVPGLNVLQEEIGIGTGEFKLPHVVDVKEARGVAHGGMLGGGAGRILHGQQVAGKLDHAAAHLHMRVVEGRLEGLRLGLGHGATFFGLLVER